ncbi:hypothetical protein GBA52_018687 [Prunus armeniaca]|nr:hypothetical protein GBA52_018687 [Prunus armeniaca]
MAYNLKNCVTAMMGCFLFILLVLPSSYAFLCEESTDCHALLKFKEGLRSDPKGHLQTWNKANPFCNWTGITCHPYLQHRVVGLELIDMDLRGGISPFISNISLLTTLSLQGNRFYGKIPSSLGGLSELAFLNVSENNLEGNIPGSLHGCQSLKVVDLNYNNLSGIIPKELSWMKNLTYLCLSQNRLTGVLPSSLSNLTELTQLELAVNYFTGKIPPQLGALRKLEILYLHMNFLEGPVPAAISNCTALREISLIENLLSGEIPLELGAKLQNLQILYMNDNKLSGRIPVTLSNLSQLTLLDLSLNNLEGEVPAELGMLKNLEVLYFHSNYYLGGGSSGNSSLSFLTALTNCSVLKKLHFGSCSFKENIPSSVGLLSNLALSLNLSNNHFEGQLPASIGKLVSLQAIDFSKNNFSGVIPSLIGSCISLVYLNLSNNMIEGTIPESLKLISHLEVLDLSHNRLNGTVPIWIANQQMIRTLNLSYNRLSGEVPYTGRFVFLNRSSFLGNVGLCGGSALIGLPPCEVQNIKHRIKNWVIYSMVAAVAVSCVLIAFFVVRFFLRKKDSKSAHVMLMESPEHHGSRTFTQRELEIATFGFNEAYLLGRGTFGSVYKGIIDNGKITVAVKVLHSDCSQSFKSFKRECQILSEIKHWNLVRMVGYTWNRGFKALILD